MKTANLLSSLILHWLPKKPNLGLHLAALWVVAIAIGHLAGLGRRTRNLLPALYIAVLADSPLQFFLFGIYIS